MQYVTLEAFFWAFLRWGLWQDTDVETDDMNDNLYTMSIIYWIVIDCNILLQYNILQYRLGWLYMSLYFCYFAWWSWINSWYINWFWTNDDVLLENLVDLKSFGSYSFDFISLISCEVLTMDIQVYWWLKVYEILISEVPGPHTNLISTAPADTFDLFSSKLL